MVFRKEGNYGMWIFVISFKILKKSVNPQRLYLCVIKICYEKN